MRYVLFSRAKQDELFIYSNSIVFVRMKNKCFSIIIARIFTEGVVLQERKCNVENINGVNQIPSCALSDRRHGAE